MASRAEHIAFAPLSTWNKLGLVFFALVVVAFGVVVEMRSAFMKRRMTDAGVYFRAAWAVRTGGDLYHIADDNDWHYNYPPLLAILMAPLADAPAGQPRDGQLDYPASVAIWFVFNLICAAVAVHWLAAALEETSADPESRHLPWGCRVWWRNRVVPLLVCLPPIAHTLMRGQVNLLLLLLIAGMLRAVVRTRSTQAGAWLAGAICLKIIPVVLLLYPLWRRDWRFLCSCTAGLIVGLGVIPSVIMGPSQTLECYRQLADGVLLPGLTHEGDSTRAKELTNITGTGSQSFVVVWHNTLHPDRQTRPTRADLWLRLAALLIGGVLGLVTLWAACRGMPLRGPSDAPRTYLAWGALMLVMLFTSPVSHMHYQCLCLPLVMGLLALCPPSGWKRWGWFVLIALFVAAHTLPHVPELSELRDFGMAMYVGLAMWLVAVVVLARSRRAVSTADDGVNMRLAA